MEEVIAIKTSGFAGRYLEARPEKEQQDAKKEGEAFWGEVLKALENQQANSSSSGTFEGKTFVAMGSGFKGLTIYLYRKCWSISNRMQAT